MADTQRAVGSVVAIWRYPIKSMQGEELNSSEVSERGLIGDRCFALVDPADGKVVSAKNPRKWPTLFAFRAAYAEAPHADAPLPDVRITVPDGRTLSRKQPDLDETLSSVLGRAVSVRSTAPKAPVLEEYWPEVEGLPHRNAVTDEVMPPNGFFDLAPLHLLTDATLDRLRAFYPQGRFETRRFRPNLLIALASGEQEFPEDQWIGKTLIVGTDVRLQVTGPCPRCVMTTLPQGDLPRDLGILRTAVQHHDGHVGVYASVLAGGTVQRGDQVHLE